MKYKLTVLSLLFCFIASANDLFKYSLEKHQKLERTIAFDTGNATMHFIVVKNKDTKKYDLIPFQMNSEQQVQQLETISFEEDPSVLSYHYENDLVSLIMYENETVSVIDLNTTTATTKLQTYALKEKPSVTFSNNGISKLLHSPDKGSTLVVTTIANTTTIKNQEIAVPKELKKTVKKLLEGNVDIVTNDSFVKNGSIEDFQLYVNNDNIYITHYDAFRKTQPKLLTITTDKNLISQRDITIPNLNKFSDFNTHSIDNTLFSSFLDKKDVVVQVTNLETGEVKGLHTLSGSLSNLNQVKSTTAAYLKEIKKLKNRPTIAINPSIENTYVVTLDIVDKNTYRHQGMAWFLNQMMWQQMRMNTGMPGGFGPFPEVPEDVLYADGPKKSVALEFVLDSNFEISENQDVKTKHDFVDKEKYGKQLAENKNVFNSSIAYLDDAYHYIYSNKKGDVVFIKSKPIKKRDVRRSE